MNNLEIFKNNEFGEIRTIIENGKVLFCGSDTAKALGYVIPSKAVNTHCKGVSKMEVPTKGGIQEMLFITEGDVYRLITHSKLPSAEKFESWVFDEVLPTIRKTGGYVNNDEMFINTYLPYADEPTKMLFRTTLHSINKLNEQVTEMKPKAEYFDALVDRNLNKNLRDTAKELKMAPSIFNHFLLSNGFLYRDTKRKLKPYQAKVAQGIFVLKEFVNKSGYADVQTLVTPKGRETFRLLVKEEH